MLDGDHPLAKSGLVPLVRLHGERETFSRLIEESVRWDLPFSVVSPTRRRLFRQTARKSRYESVGIDDAPALLTFEKQDQYTHVIQSMARTTSMDHEI